MGDKDVAWPDMARHPGPAKLALPELRRAREAAGDQRLGSGSMDQGSRAFCVSLHLKRGTPSR
jgi:hypothetical protein